MTHSPENAAKLDRARSLCNHACWSCALQVRRLRSEEPEDQEFIFRFWADLQYLIVALRRMRRAALIAAFEPDVNSAIAEFDRSLPDLAKMRNVGEHIDDYAADSPKRRHRDVSRTALQVGEFDGTVFSWLGGDLNIDEALRAAETIYGDPRRFQRKHPAR
jgi:hypothetical protein